jgi:hypothetical protein
MGYGFWAAPGEQITEFHKWGPLFDLHAEGSSLVATCTLRRADGAQACGQKIKLGKSDMKCGPLKSHLTNAHHGKLYFGIDSKADNKSEGGGGAASSSSEALSKRPRSQVDGLSVSTTPALECLDISPLQYKETVLKTILMNAQPLSFVESIGWNYFSDRMRLPRLYMKSMEDLFDEKYQDMVLRPQDRQMRAYLESSSVTVETACGRRYTFSPRFWFGADGWKGKITMESIVLYHAGIVDGPLVDAPAGEGVVGALGAHRKVPGPLELRPKQILLALHPWPVGKYGDAFEGSHFGTTAHCKLLVSVFGGRGV